MKIGFVGLGKLGLPCAIAIDMKGHDVMGYDVNSSRMQKDHVDYREEGPNGEPTIEGILRESGLSFGTLDEVIAHGSDLIFVAVQTPHDPRYEGVTPLPPERKDFDYTYLVAAMQAISDAVEKLGEKRTVIIISTVLPGTLRTHVLPKLNRLVKLCYNPFFIAMGTAMRDFLNPEFVLFGVADNDAAKKAEKFYRTIHSAQFYKTTVENAELIKVAYNTYIGMKIVFANVFMELCHKLPGTDVDSVLGCLKLAGNRLISGKYFSGGMGDGGGCHPRDNIALSWLSREHDLSYDWFEAVMLAREKQTEWLADLMETHHTLSGLPLVILGKAFKPETNLTVGSPSILLKNILEARGISVTMYDPYVDDKVPDFTPSVFLIGTKHDEFTRFPYPAGSVVIDPWRYIPDIPDVIVIPVGGKK